MHSEYANFHHYLIKNAGLKENDFEQLVDYFSVKDYQKGQIILSEGSISKYIFFVEKGLLRFYSLDASGKEHIMQFATENWWLTDRNNLCSDEPSEYYIDAYENSKVILLSHEFIQKATEISAEFRSFHEKLLQKHIKQLYHRIKLLIGTPAKESYLEFTKTYPTISQRVPQWMIASYLGITPEFLSRVRKELVS